MNFRPATSQDYVAIAEWENQRSPEWPTSADRVHHQESTWPKSAYRRNWIVEAVGRGAIGFVTLSYALWLPHPGRYIARIVPCGGMTVEEIKACLAFLRREATEVQARELLIPVRSDDPNLANVILNSDFSEIESSVRLERQLSIADAEVFAKTDLGDIRCSNFETLEAEGMAWMRPLYEATLEMTKDIPTQFEVEDFSYEAFQSQIGNPESAPRNLMFAALDGNKIVAYTRYEANAVDPTRIQPAFGGTVRSHRRQGIMTALKHFAFAQLYNSGARTVFSANLKNNPMLGLNESLGFKEIFRAAVFSIALEP